jgi:hypothetical protein
MVVISGPEPVARGASRRVVGNLASFSNEAVKCEHPIEGSAEARSELGPVSEALYSRVIQNRR